MRSRYRWTGLMLLLALSVLFAPAALVAQSPGDPPADPIGNFLEGLNGDLWLFLLFVGLFGMLGGFVYELLSLGGRIEWPHRTDDVDPAEKLEYAIAKYLFDLGVFGRIIIGALAAVVVVHPLGVVEDGPLAVISVSILAGAAGIAVFRSLQDRLLAALAARELVRAREQAVEQSVVQEAKIDEIAGEFEQLKEKIQAQTSSPAKVKGFSFDGGTTVELLPELESITQKLGEARALAMVARTLGISIRQRVYGVLGIWAGVPINKVPPDTKEILRLWRENNDNPLLSDGHLGNLIVRLRSEFPQAGLNLNPADLGQNGRFNTIGKLVLLVETSMIGRR